MQTLKLTKKYETHPEYKDSGVEWLGKIPANWEAQKIVSVFNFSNQKVTEATHEPLSVTYDGIKKQIENAAKVAEGSLRKLVKVGDIAINGRSDRKGAVGMSEYEGGVSLVYNVLRKRDQLSDSKYFHYLFRSKLFSEEFYRWGRGIVDDLWTTRESEMKRICIAVPKSEEQTKIARYLDEKISSVDQIIEKKQKQIELLKEKRSETINTAVTKVTGKTEKLKYVAPERKIKLDSAPVNLRYIGLENLESLTGRIVDSKEKSEPESSVNIFYKSDVLFGKLRPYLAKVLATDFDGVCSGEFLTLVPKKAKIISKYLFYKLLSKDFIKAINDSTYGTKMPRANWQFIGNQVITYPSLDEQIKIVKSLDNKLEIFEKSIADINKSIEFLQEFKSSLISNVVTGKIKV
jgi:type I restriction enzyme S subunit